MDFLEQTDRWLPAEAGAVYAILDNLSAHRAADVLLFSLAHPRWEFVFQPVYAAYLNLIEPWWKTLRSLALKGRRFETWEQIVQAVVAATAYWNLHRHPLVRRSSSQFGVVRRLRALLSRKASPTAPTANAAVVLGSGTGDGVTGITGSTRMLGVTGTIGTVGVTGITGTIGVTKVTSELELPPWVTMLAMIGMPPRRPIGN